MIDAVGESEYGSKEIMSAAVFLASKVYEEAVRLRDVINCVYLLSKMAPDFTSSIHVHAPTFDLVVYNKIRERVLLAE